MGIVLANVFTAGIAASNAGKTILAGIFTNGKKFFSFKYLVVAILLPLALLFAIQQLQYYQVEIPQEKSYTENCKYQQKETAGKI